MAVSFEETVRRHQRREEPIPVTEETMRGWYAERDLLGVDGEQIIPESVDFEGAVTTILAGSGLDQAKPLTPCPTRCPRCREKNATFSPDSH